MSWYFPAAVLCIEVEICKQEVCPCLLNTLLRRIPPYVMFFSWGDKAQTSKADLE